MSKLITFIIAVSLTAITVLADYFIKKSSLLNNVWNKWLLIGALIYGLTAIGWVFVMKYIKLSTAGVIYGVSGIILVTIMSVFIFHERLSILEIVGISFGIMALIFLYRFS